MTTVFETWSIAPAYPELMVSFPDGSSLPCRPNNSRRSPLPPGKKGSRAQMTSLRKSIELGERLIRMLEEQGEFNLTRRGPKPNSLRALSCRLLGVVPPSTLWRAVAIYQLAQAHPELWQYKHLGVAHLSVVLRFRGPLRLGLLRKAEAERWSRRKLQRVAREISQHPELEWVSRLSLGSI